MKNSLYLVFIIFFSVPAYTQDLDGEPTRDPKAREKIKAAHAAYITERLELTPAEAEKFWPLYREYGEKRNELRRQLREAKRKGEDEKTLLALDLQIKQQELDLEKEYSIPLEKAISAAKMVRLRQAEIDFRKLLLRQIQKRHRQR